MKPEQAELARLRREVIKFKAERDIFKKSRGLLRDRGAVTFASIATHRGIWPTEWWCEALGVSRAGVYAWRTRSPSARARANDQLLTRVRASFLASDRTYGARRVWHDLLVDGCPVADIGLSG